MKWNDLTLLFLWIFLCCITVLFWRNRLIEELYYQKLLIDRNLDTIAEDCLYASIEGIQEDFEPIINSNYLFERFLQEKDWIFGKGNIEVPLLFLTEKEQELICQTDKNTWESYLISGYSNKSSNTYAYPNKLSMSEAILRTDEIQKILQEELNKTFFNTNQKYHIFLPYTEQEEGLQKIEKTGLWYLFSSRSYQVNNKSLHFFTYSGARSIRKQQ